VLGWTLRILALLFLLRLVLRFLAGVVRGLQGPARGSARTAPELGVDLVRDPVCRTHLPRAQALSAVVAGRTEHFCSAACRDRARAAS
jgi:YHS domain-containing protein